MFLKIQLACSFCGKSAAEVSKLVAGPKVYMCDVCVGGSESHHERLGLHDQPNTLAPTDMTSTINQAFGA